MRLPSVPAGLNVTVWPPVLATRGPGSRSALHSHHGLHFVLALERDLRVRTSAFAPWSSAPGVLTGPDVPHAIDSVGTEVLFVFLDPESDAGATFGPALAPPVRLLSRAERATLVRGVVPRTLFEAGAEAWVQDAARVLRLPPPPSRRTVHPRVRKLLAMLRTSGVDDDTSLEVLAGLVHLSPSRLMHVFTASVGIPLRPYLGWLRLQRAAIAIVSGKALGDAAHGAGFADAAHMSRTFKRMLGIAPSLLRPMRCAPSGAQPAPRTDGEHPLPDSARLQSG